MPIPGRVAMVVVAGGIALGSILGAAAHPEPKRPPEAPWRGGLQAPVVADAGYLTIEAPPQDLSPYRDSYAPTWAREEVTDWEPDYPAWTYSEWIEEPAAELSPAEEAGLDAQQVAAAAEAAAAPEEPAKAVASTEPVPQPELAAYPRQASHLDDLY